MILKYYGFNNNWVFEEAEQISQADVYIGDITKKYRKGNSSYHKYYGYLFEDNKTPDEETKNSAYLRLVNNLYNDVSKKLEDETKCGSEISYIIGDRELSDLENVSVVTLKDKHKFLTFVFNQHGVAYLLNNRGQTVQRLA